MNIRRGDRVRDQKELWREYFQYKVLPPWWIPVKFTENEVIQAIAMANGLDMSAADEIELDIPKYANSKTKNKIVGRLGKIAVFKYYGFRIDRLFSKSKGTIDFVVGRKNITVKTSSFLKSEVVLLNRTAIENDRGAHIFIAVNIDYDDRDVWSTTAYVVGWITKQGFDDKGLISEDVGQDLLFVRMNSLSKPYGLKKYLRMLEGC